MIFIKSVLLFYLSLVIHGLIKKIELKPIKKHIPKSVATVSSTMTLGEIIDHPIMVASGLYGEIPTAEAEEVHPEWSINYFKDEEDNNDFQTILIINQNEKQSNSNTKLGSGANNSSLPCLPNMVRLEQ